MLSFFEKFRKGTRSEYLIDEDISKGRESVKIPALSYKRQDKAPNDYHYVCEYVHCEPLSIDRTISNMQSCKCVGNCSDSNTCTCSSMSFSGGRFYGPDGCLSAEYKIDMPEVINECNIACGCNAKACRNRVIQAGCRARLVLFRTKTRGWGVRTLEDLKRGTFIGVYSGELISVQTSQLRRDDTYLFDLASRSAAAKDKARQKQQEEEKAQNEDPLEDEEEAAEVVDETMAATANEQELAAEPVAPVAIESTFQQDADRFVCDAKFYGNFTRFINHSCEPNVIGVRSFTSHQDNRFPYISFFTNKQVAANSELTLNYGDNYWLVKCKRDNVYCLCKNESCRFTKRTLAHTAQLYNQAQEKTSTAN